MSITSETYWAREIVPAPLDSCFRACCDHFGTSPLGGGTKGNASHTYGRHRSYEWCRRSAFCTDRSYGTTDQRDKDGEDRHIRAFDVPLGRVQIRDVSRRLNNAVRAGDAPMIAEWFGTFDNVNVVGWFEGEPSSSDDSHLSHVHVGLWTKYANDVAALNTVYEIMTGDTMAITSADAKVIAAELAKNKDFLAAVAKANWDADQIPAPRAPFADPDFDTNPTWQADNTLRAIIEGQRQHHAEVMEALKAGIVVNAKVDLTDEAVAAVADATADEIHADPERDGV